MESRFTLTKSHVLGISAVACCLINRADLLNPDGVNKEPTFTESQIGNALSLLKDKQGLITLKDRVYRAVIVAPALTVAAE